MYINEYFILLALHVVLKSGALHLKREVKYIESNKLSNIATTTEVTRTTARSFLECASRCGQTAVCLSLFYKDHECWFVGALFEFSTNYCFQTRTSSTAAFVGLNEAAWTTGPTNSSCSVNTDVCPASIPLHCASSRFAYNTCLVPGASHIFSMEVGEQLSNSPCVDGISFGYTRDSVWVDEGCRALFVICFLEI